MKTALIITLALAVLVLFWRNGFLTAELRAEQVKVLERELDGERLHAALVDRGGDADRERMYEADIAQLKAELVAARAGTVTGRVLTTQEQLDADLRLLQFDSGR